MPFAIIVEYVAKAEFRAELERHLRDGCVETLADDGCERMELAVSRADPMRLVLNELWRDEAALAAHRAKPGHDESHAAYAHMAAEKRVLVADLI
jgi:quinol monooxygenase YgiN